LSRSYFYALSLHDALPILCLLERVLYLLAARVAQVCRIFFGKEGRNTLRFSTFNTDRDAAPNPADSLESRCAPAGLNRGIDMLEDRKSTRLNSSHVSISYA